MIYEAIEYLENALHNVGGLRRGLPLHDVVEEQIKSALAVLIKMDESEDGA